MSEIAPQLQFSEVCTSTDVEITPHHEGLISSALRDEHYGFVMVDNLRAATALLKEGKSNLPLEVMPKAMSTLAVLLRESGVYYRQTDTPPAEADWSKHIRRVRQGEIEL